MFKPFNMILRGHYNGETNGKLFRGPIFDSDIKIITFDFEGVFDVQKGHYENGKRNGADEYFPHKQAKIVLSQALNDFDRVVLWSTQERVLDLKGFPYSEVHQYIAGAQFVDERGNLIRNYETEGELVKSLGILTENINNVVALEDKSSSRLERCSFFRPLSRVAKIREHENLMLAYLRARKMMSRKEEYTTA